MCLPYWNSEIDIEAGSWASARKARGLVSMARLHGPQLAKLASLVLNCDSELLYICGRENAPAGSMLWDDAVLERRVAPDMLPFTLVLGYSRKIEKIAAAITERVPGLRAGVTDCTFWNGGVPLERYKVIAFLAALPVFDESAFLDTLVTELKNQIQSGETTSFYAERLGFVRAPVPYETDVPAQMLMFDELDSFQLDATRSVVGPAPSVPLPVFFELASLGNGEESRER